MNKTPPSQDDNYNFYDDQINLSGIIDVLLERKWLILGGSFLCALIVGTHSFLTPRLYKAETIILVSPSIVKPNAEGEEAQVSEITVSSLEASTYKVLAKSMTRCNQGFLRV